MNSVQRRGSGWFLVAMLAPAFLFYMGFVVVPLIQAFHYSVYDWSGLTSDAKAVGFGNYQKIAVDPVFRTTLWHNLLILVFGGFLCVGIAIAVALLMQQRGKLSRVLKSSILIPQMISLVVVAVMWQFLYNPNFGPFTSAMKLVGLKDHVPTWLGDPHWALPSVILAFIWYACGFYTMLFAAAMGNLDQEIVEAAGLDGASGWVRLRKVTWPMLWSIRKIVWVHISITVANIFVLVQVLTNGGPARATDVMLTYLYEQGFKNTNFGYASALAVCDFVFIMLLSLVILTLMKKDPTSGAARARR